MKNKDEDFELRKFTVEEINCYIDSIRCYSDDIEFRNLICFLRFAINSLVKELNSTIAKQDENMSMAERRYKTLEEEYETLEKEIYNDNYCVIGDYDELKRQMEINGLWDDKIEFWMENFCRFHNNLT